MYYLMIEVFIFGYLLIVLEHNIHINKAATALIMGAGLWALYAIGAPEILELGYSESWKDWLTVNPNSEESMVHFLVHHELTEHLSEIASIVFFLMGAMTIVEVIDEYQGFRIITNRIKVTNKAKLLVIISFMTFFLSAALDNLTTTIVIVAVLSKLIKDDETRWYFASMVVISANAGGAWSPIGDVTTIMLWIGGQITALKIIEEIFLPSLVAMILPLIVLAFKLKGEIDIPKLSEDESAAFIPLKDRVIVLVMGITALLMVPVIKSYTHLPPFIGMLLGLGAMWFITDFKLHSKTLQDKRHLNVGRILSKIDMPTVLFLMGILLAVGALSSAGHLNVMAGFMQEHFQDIYLQNTLIGVLSAIVDNVPIVAAFMGMYDIAPDGSTGELANFVVDGKFWEMLAYASGTGGSILIVGSAAGVAAMGMERISFLWYLKNIAWIAALGYIGGISLFYLEMLVM
ncbi:sodium:proton antiporter [Flammeovirga kamogawensis]|uniref:Sodium:proton antiporter NhaD n=2 Tax=Flammeovirga kamogawensis TaxID=373891 RepID=A0ABX8H0T6_9BACT|nr:sodium:proton antiporter NhaD [Flammeovirga kamogawensis]TRX70130.1 sodium:proton antiporter [Flammeovirga kamogawensis]